MYRQDLTLNSLQELKCHKTQLAKRFLVRSLCGEVANVLDGVIVVSEFKLL